MSDRTVHLTEEVTGEWRIEEAKSVQRDDALTTVPVSMDDIHVNSAYSGKYRVTVPNVVHMEAFSQHGARAVWDGERPIAPKGDATEDMECIDNIQLNGTPEQGPDVELRDFGEIPEWFTPASPTSTETGEGVTPIVAESENTEQRTAARLDRRPYIRVCDREKYTKVVVSTSPTGYQLSPTAIRDIATLAEEAYVEAEASGEQRPDVYMNVTAGRFTEFPSLDRQTIVVDELMIEYAHPLIEEIVAYLETTPDALCRYAQATEAVEESAVAEATVPRPTAGDPTAVSAVSGAGRHAPLSDTTPNEDVHTYVSPTAQRIARHIQSDVTVSIDRENEVVVADDSLNGYTATVTFNEGDPVSHSCECPSELEPCEHVAALLNDLPPYSTVYTGDIDDR